MSIFTRKRSTHDLGSGKLLAADTPDQGMTFTLLMYADPCEVRRGDYLILHDSKSSRTARYVVKKINSRYYDQDPINRSHAVSLTAKFSPR